MKYSKLLFFFALSVMVALSSCKKEEVSEMTDTIEDVKPDVTTTNNLVYNLESSTAAEGLDLGCFSVDMPFGLIVDGTEVTINTVEDFDDALINNAAYVDFAYPLNITYPDGATGVVADGEELGEAFASCIPDTGWTNNDGFPAFLICELNFCYQMVYPVNLVDGDGNEFTVNSEDEFIDLISTNPELYFEFPLSLTDIETGDVVTADDDEALFDLLSECDGIYNPGPGVDTTWTGGGFLGCYELVYPFDVIDLDGATSSVANEDEFITALFNGDVAGFGFPLTVTDEDGETVVFNNQEEFDEALFECFGTGPGWDGIDIFSFVINSDAFDTDCYAITYPFEAVSVENGDVLEIADQAAAIDYINNYPEFRTVVLPVEVTVLATGEVVSITNPEEIFPIWTNCQ